MPSPRLVKEKLMDLTNITQQKLFLLVFGVVAIVYIICWAIVSVVEARYENEDETNDL